MGIGAGDHIDALLVEKYSNKTTVNPELSNKIIDKSFLQQDYNLEKDLDNFIDIQFEDSFCNLREEYKNQKTTFNKRKHKAVSKEMQDFKDPNKMYERLGVDLLSITVAANLISIAAPEKNGSLFPQITVFRHKMVDQLGYIIPNIRIMDSLVELEDNTYIISVRGNVVFEGKLSDEDVQNNNSDKIIGDLYRMCMKYAHQIVTKSYAIKMMELVRSQDPTLVNDLVPIFLSPIDLKHIFANLYQAKISVKDILLVFEILNDHARFTQDRNELTEILIKELNFNINP